MKKSKLDASVNEIILNYSNAPEDLLSKSKLINSLSFTYDEYLMPSKSGGQLLTMYGAGFDSHDVKILDYKLVFELLEQGNTGSFEHKLIEGIIQLYDLKTTRFKW